MIHMIVELTAAPGKTDALVDAIRAIAAAPCDGTEVYVVSVDDRDPHRVLISEVYRDAAALAAHEQLPAFKALAPLMPTLLAALPKISRGVVR